MRLTLNDLMKQNCMEKSSIFKSFKFHMATNRLSLPRASFRKDTGLHFLIVNPKSIKFPDFPKGLVCILDLLNRGAKGSALSFEWEVSLFGIWPDQN